MPSCDISDAVRALRFIIDRKARERALMLKCSKEEAFLWLIQHPTEEMIFRAGSLFEAQASYGYWLTDKVNYGHGSEETIVTSILENSNNEGDDDLSLT